MQAVDQGRHLKRRRGVVWRSCLLGKRGGVVLLLRRTRFDRLSFDPPWSASRLLALRRGRLAEQRSNNERRAERKNEGRLHGQPFTVSVMNVVGLGLILGQKLPALRESCGFIGLPRVFS